MLTQRHMMFALKGKFRKTTNVFQSEFDRPMKSGEMTANDRKIYILTRKKRHETLRGGVAREAQEKKSVFYVQKTRKFTEHRQFPTITQLLHFVCFTMYRIALFGRRYFA